MSDRQNHLTPGTVPCVGSSDVEIISLDDASLENNSCVSEQIQSTQAEKNSGGESGELACLISNTRVRKIQQLTKPSTLLEKYPLNEQEMSFIRESRRQLEDIISGKDTRFIVVIGPCSIHNVDAALEYASRLSFFCELYKDKLMIVMRVYFEKPRTTVGWKGFVYDPYLNNTCEINEGLDKARQLMREITRLKVPIGCEFLDTITPQFFSDLVSWGAIGARTTESQIHRQLVSGLSMPVGFKNGTDGSIKIAVDGILAAREQHTFVGVDESGQSSIVHTLGNPYTHVILRGSTKSPNYSAEFIDEASELLAREKERILVSGLGPKPVSQTEKELSRWLCQQVMIDCSHDNSKKNYRFQKFVLDEVLETKSRPYYRDKILGVMIESNLVEGSQKVSEVMVYGQSITDGCIGWIETIELLKKIYHKIP